MLLVLATGIPTASAAALDLLFGRAAVPGSELHALGTTAMSRNNGDATYFTICLFCSPGLKELEKLKCTGTRFGRLNVDA